MLDEVEAAGRRGYYAAIRDHLEPTANAERLAWYEQTKRFHPRVANVGKIYPPQPSNVVVFDREAESMVDLALSGWGMR